jgi:hypothetical protein
MLRRVTEKLSVVNVLGGPWLSPERHGPAVALVQLAGRDSNLCLEVEHGKPRGLSAV